MGNSLDKSDGEAISSRKGVSRSLRIGRKRSYTLSADLKCSYSVEGLVSNERERRQRDKCAGA